MDEATSNRSDGDHEVDDWSEKQIGFLAARVLSDVAKARKRTEGANAVAPSVSIARALGGLEDTASNRKRSGGVVAGFTGAAYRSVIPQLSPDTGERDNRKDRTVKYPVDL
ncbi:hypothetical protein [Phyllobacterium ifriqiyense]|uniref:hypothetical protein n=1 Tax=Phyllobacterium ifriqiyense TaxID=314238 RepID=UPI00339A6669